jgi:hypothetical protein
MCGSGVSSERDERVKDADVDVDEQYRHIRIASIDSSGKLT